MYLILLKEFQREKFEKEKANEIQMERDEMKVISIKKEQEKAKEQQEKEKKETVIKASAEKLSGPSVLGKINIDSTKKDKVEAEKPALSSEKEVKPTQEVVEKSTKSSTDAVDSTEPPAENESVKTIKAEA